MWHQYKILEGHFLHLSGQNVDFHSEFTFLYMKGARVSIYATHTHTHVIKLVIEGLNKLVTLKYMKNYTVNKFKKNTIFTSCNPKQAILYSMSPLLLLNPNCLCICPG